MSEEYITFTDILNNLLDKVPDHMWFTLTFGKELFDATGGAELDPDKVYVMETNRGMVKFNVDKNQEDFVKFNWYHKEELCEIQLVSQGGGKC